MRTGSLLCARRIAGDASHAAPAAVEARNERRFMVKPPLPRDEAVQWQVAAMIGGGSAACQCDRAPAARGGSSCGTRHVDPRTDDGRMLRRGARALAWSRWSTARVGFVDWRRHGVFGTLASVLIDP